MYEQNFTIKHEITSLLAKNGLDCKTDAFRSLREEGVQWSGGMRRPNFYFLLFPIETSELCPLAV